METDINRHDGSVDRAVGSDSQGCVFKPHQGQNLFFFFLYIIWNRKSALRSLNQEKSKKFFLILKLEVIPHRMPLRRKKNHRNQKPKKKTSNLVLISIPTLENFFLTFLMIVFTP